MRISDFYQNVSIQKARGPVRKTRKTVVTGPQMEGIKTSMAGCGMRTKSVNECEEDV